MQLCVDKKIIDFILEEDIPRDITEDIFYELYLVYPYSSDVLLSDMHLYQRIYFHSKDLYHSMLAEFEKILKSDEKSILRKRFRAFLALIYLNGMKENMFKGCKKLLENKENVEPCTLAYEVYNSENFKDTFLKADSILAQKDGIVTVEML